MPTNPAPPPPRPGTRRATRATLAALAAGTLLLTACGDDTDAVGAGDTSEEVTSTTASTGDASALVGTWTTSDGPMWEVTDDSITASLPGGDAIESTYTATGSILEMNDLPGPRACPPEQTGTYEWDVDGDVLSLTAISDECGRKNTLDGISFRRVEPGSSPDQDQAGTEDTRPQGVSQVSAGDTVETPRLGGLRFVVPEERELYQAPGLVAIGGVPTAIDLVSVVETLEGEPIDSVDTVVSLIEEASVVLDEADPTTIAGHQARVLDFTVEREGEPRPDDAVFRFEEDGIGGWGPVGEGRVWLLDTQRGILLFAAGVLEPGEADLADVIAEAEAIFATLELVEIES